MRLIGFEWRLREVMAAAGMFSTTKLVPLLEERGVYLSTSQVYRLAAEKPERMNMQALVALQPFHIEQGHSPAFQPNPPARHEVSKRLVDRLTRSTNQLGQLFLGQIVRDMDS